MVIPFIGFDLLLHEPFGYDRIPFAGHVWGICFRPPFDFHVLIWIS